MAVESDARGRLKEFAVESGEDADDIVRARRRADDGSLLVYRFEELADDKRYGLDALDFLLRTDELARSPELVRNESFEPAAQAQRSRMLSSAKVAPQRMSAYQSGLTTTSATFVGQAEGTLQENPARTDISEDSSSMWARVPATFGWEEWMAFAGEVESSEYAMRFGGMEMLRDRGGRTV